MAVFRPEHIAGGEIERTGTGQSRREKAQGELMHVCKYLTGGCKGTRPFSLVPRDRTEGNAIDQYIRNLFLTFGRKSLFTVRVVKLWNRFPRSSVESPSLEISKFNRV